MNDITNDMFKFCFPVISNEAKLLGCAFKWGKSRFITCKHVLEEVQGQVRLQHYGANEQSFLLITEVIRSDEHDLCVLVAGEEELPQLDHYKMGDTLPLGLDVTLYGYTQSPHQKNTIEPRCIKTYVHRSGATPNEHQIKEGVLEVNEFNIQIPVGFSGGPILIGDKLLGMSLGTNITEKPLYRYDEEVVAEENQNGSILHTTIVEKNLVDYYGLFHTIQNVKRIIDLLDHN